MHHSSIPLNGSFQLANGVLSPRVDASRVCLITDPKRGGGGGGVGGTPYNNLYGKAPPEMGTFFGLQVYERVGISLVEVYERVEKSVSSVGKKVQKSYQIHFMHGCGKSRENNVFYFLFSYLKTVHLGMQRSKQGM